MLITGQDLLSIMNQQATNNQGAQLQDIIIAAPLAKQKLRIVSGLADVAESMNDLVEQSIEGNKAEVTVNKSDFAVARIVVSQTTQDLKKNGSPKALSYLNQLADKSMDNLERFFVQQAELKKAQLEESNTTKS